MSVEFEDNTMKAIEALADGLSAAMYEAGAELQTQGRRNSRVDTGVTKGSYDYKENQCLPGQPRCKSALIWKMPSGKNMVLVSMLYTVMEEKAVGCTRMRKVIIIIHMVKLRISHSPEHSRRQHRKSKDILQ